VFLKILTIARTLWLELLRKKDLYVLLILLASMLVGLISLDVLGLGGTVGYVKDVGLLLAWLFGWGLTVTIASRTLPQEETRGTVFALLAKPVSRAEVIIGKWLGTWATVSGALVVFYTLVVTVAAVKGGKFYPVVLVQAFLLHSVAMGIVAAVSLALSTRLNADATATLSYVFAVAVCLVLPRAPEFAATQGGAAGNLVLAVYHALPRMALFDFRRRMVHGFGPVSWHTLGAVLCYGVIFIAIYLTVAWLGYRNKRFSRTTVE
jgi:Cu-processing system permease protein